MTLLCEGYERSASLRNGEDSLKRLREKSWRVFGILYLERSRAWASGLMYGERRRHWAFVALFVTVAMER